MRYGITGHRRLPPAAADFALRHWSDTLPGGQSVLGVSSLAEGADQLFAEHVLALGGRLEVIEPCVDYARSFATAAARHRYGRLVRAATEIITLPYPGPGREAYLAAGLVVVERCDHLFALWDGLATRGLGGTGDVVRYAAARKRSHTVLWPQGLIRI
jgi:hypothetical protein